MSTETSLTTEQWIAFHLSPLQQGMLCIVLPMTLACAGLLLTRQLVHQRFLRQHHDMAGPFFNTMGSIYGIFLAFIVANTWQFYAATGSNVVQEARCLQSLHDDAAAFPQPFRGELRTLLRQYRESLVSEGWKSLRKGRSNAETSALALKIAESYVSHPVGTLAESTYFHESVKNLETMNSLRASRIDDASSGLIPFLWCILIAGAVVTIGFSYLFSAQNFTTHAVMTLLLTGLIGLTFYTIITLDFPFTGFVAISPDAFLRVKMM
jgi:hypothetical protein